MRASRTSSRFRFRSYQDRRRSDKDWAKREVDRAGRDKRSLARSRGFFELFRAFWGMTRGHRVWVGLALGTLTTSVVLALLTAASTKFTIDYVLTDSPGPSGIPGWAREALRLPDTIDQNPEPLLWYTAAFMVGVALIAAGLAIFGRWHVTRITKRIQVELRRRAFEHAVSLPLHRVQHYKTGGMSSLLREDAGTAGDLLFSLVYNPWRAVVTLLGTLIVLAATDWRLLAGGLLLIPVMWLTHKTWIARIRPLYRDAKQARQAIDSSTTEAFGGLRVVRGFSRSRSESSRFVTGQHYMTRIEVLTWWWSRILELAWAVLIPVASAGVLIYCGREVLRGTLTVGDLMLFTTYLLMLLGPLETLTSTATTVQTNLAALDRVLTLLEETPEFAGTGKGVEVVRGQVRGALALERVTYVYPKAAFAGREVGSAQQAEMDEEAPDGDGSDEAGEGAQPLSGPVLHEISLSVNPGEVIALVGPSGAGKTTLCNLIARFDDPTHGRITLDGRDLRDIDVASYRRLLGIVEQDVFLFDGTVAENIAYARRDASLAMVQAAARAAHAEEFIQGLEQGYDTFIGERGVRLSGGQKQRLALARALLADPVLLILDEATSNLDTQSERLIQQSLERLMRGRTCFVIAHRLSTVRRADRIVVLDKGRIVEVGTHEQLMERGGLYASLVRMQMEPHDAIVQGSPGDRAPG